MVVVVMVGGARLQWWLDSDGWLISFVRFRGRGRGREKSDGERIEVREKYIK